MEDDVGSWEHAFVRELAVLLWAKYKDTVVVTNWSYAEVNDEKKRDRQTNFTYLSDFITQYHIDAIL